MCFKIPNSANHISDQHTPGQKEIKINAQRLNPEPCWPLTMHRGALIGSRPFSISNVKSKHWPAGGAQPGFPCRRWLSGVLIFIIYCISNSKLTRPNLSSLKNKKMSLHCHNWSLSSLHLIWPAGVVSLHLSSTDEPLSAVFLFVWGFFQQHDSLLSTKVFFPSVFPLKTI